MYKIFFQDRVIILTDDFVDAFRHNYGLFYKYYDLQELKDLFKLFTYLTKIKKLYIFHNNVDHIYKDFSSLFTLINAAGGVVRSSSGKTLVFNRRNKWDLPKGKVDNEETSAETALREIEEECGISDLTLGEEIITTYHTYIQDNRPILKKTIWFHVHYAGDEASIIPQISEDITEIIWLQPEDLNMILGNTYLSIIDVLREAKLLRF